MGFWSSVCDFVSDVARSVATVCRLIAPFSGPLAPLVNAVAVVASTIAAVTTTISAVCKELGIWEADDRAEDLGDRAIQASEQGIRPDTCPDYATYLQELRNLPLDPEKSAKYTLEEKLGAASLIGMIGIGGHFKLTPQQMADWATVLGRCAPSLDAGRLQTWLSAGVDASQLCQKIDGTLSVGDSGRLYERIAASEQRVHPEDSNRQIYDRLDRMVQDARQQGPTP